MRKIFLSLIFIILFNINSVSAHVINANDSTIILTNTTLNRDTGLIELSDSVPDFIHRYRFDGTGLMVYDENITSNANGNITQWGWNTIATPPTRQDQQGVEEANGIIYSIGGIDGSSVLLNFTYAYNISNNTWSAKAPAPIKVQSPILRNVSGKLYLIGGYDSVRYYNTTYMYDPAGDNWTQLANMSVGREDMASAVVGNTIYIFGGIDKQVVIHNITSRTEAYNTVTNTWSNKSNMPSPRALGDYGASYGGKIYLVSGVSDMSVYPTLIQDTTFNVYDPSLDSFSSLASIPVGLAYKEVEVIQDRLYVFSGATTSNAIGSTYAFVYNISTNAWSRLPDMPYNPVGMGDAVYGNTVYTVGGGTIAAHNFTFYPDAANKSTGKFGNAVDFDGKKVYIPLNNANKLLNGGTIIFFAKNWSGGTIIARDNGTTNMGHGGYVFRTTGSNTSYFRTNASTEIQSNVNYRFENDSTYHLYAITFNNTGRQFWRDGTNWGTKFGAATELPGSTANNTDIGRASVSLNNVFLNASLDDLRIYDRFLTVSDMTYIKNNNVSTIGNITILNKNTITRIRATFSGQNNYTNITLYSRSNGTSVWNLIQSNISSDIWYNITSDNQFNSMDIMISLQGNSSSTPIFTSIELDQISIPTTSTTSSNPLADFASRFLVVVIIMIIVGNILGTQKIFNNTISPIFVKIIAIVVVLYLLSVIL